MVNNEEDIRSVVKSMYPLSSKWAKRVDAMPFHQVYAIHLRQCRVEDEERKLRELKQEMREALLEENSEDKLDEFLQEPLFKEN